jgi:hypothetical protein
MAINKTRANASNISKYMIQNSMHDTKANALYKH